MAAINYTITNIGNTSITSFTFEFVTPVQVELHADFSTIKSGESSDFTGTSYTISDLDLLPSSTASFSIDYTYLSGSIGTYNGLVTVTGYNSTGEKVRTVTTEITIVTPMTLIYDTSLSPTTEIQLPLYGTVNVVVDWGDGITEVVTTEGNTSHTYATNGTYTVSITGTLTHFGTESISSINASSLIACTSWGNLGLTSLSYAFWSCGNLTTVPNNIPSTVTDLSGMFMTAYAFNQNINSWDVSDVTNMRYMFFSAESYNQPLNNWNVSNVTDIYGMFTDAYVFNQSLNNWDVSSVTDMSFTFNGCYDFNQPLDNWNVSNVTNMKYMFNGANSFNQPLNNWDVSNVTDMSYMFNDAIAFNQNISNWCVTLIPSEPTNFSTGSPLTAPNKPVWGTCPSPMTLVYDTTLSPTTEIQLPLYGAVNATINWGDGITEVVTTEGNISHTYATNGTYTVSIAGTVSTFGSYGFINPTSLTSVTSWGTLGTIDFTEAFAQCTNLTSVPSIAPPSAIFLDYMFHQCSSFNQNINSWDVSAVTAMRGIFYGATSFNQPLNNWNVSSVTDMAEMFGGATAFNQPIDSWNVGSATDMEYMFYGAASFNQPLNSWNVSNVIDMQNMFAGASSFNQNIASWNVGSVTRMNSMFANASIFNQDIGSWNVSNVNGTIVGMGLMFSNASSFNQNLSGWCVTNILTEPTNFSTGSPLTTPNKPVWGTCPP